MEIVTFKECNTVYAENQPEYLSLPAYRADDGRITSCWKLSFFERLKVMFRGKVFLQVLTFNQPLQPLLMLVNNPIK